MYVRLPLEIILNIFEYSNPIKSYYTVNIVLALKSRYNFSKVMKELTHFRVHDQQGLWYFSYDSLLASFDS